MKLTIDINDDTIQGVAALLKMQSCKDNKEQVNKAVEALNNELVELSEDWITMSFGEDAQNIIMVLAMAAIAKVGNIDLK